MKTIQFLLFFLGLTFQVFSQNTDPLSYHNSQQLSDTSYSIKKANGDSTIFLFEGNSSTSDPESNSVPSFDDITATGASSTRDIEVNGISFGLGTGEINTNMVIGGDALVSNTTGDENCAIGLTSLHQNTTGRSNVALGAYTMYHNISGNSNVAVGAGALARSTTGSYNTGVGYSALTSLANGISNTGIGFGAFYFSNHSNWGTAIGVNALRYNEGDENCALGYLANGDFIANTSIQKTFSASSISGTNITITGHGFGNDGDLVLLQYTQGTSSISGLDNNGIYEAVVIDDNTISIPSIAGGGTATGAILTPQYHFSNTISLGSYSHPTQSDQVVLGDENVTQVLTYGNVLSKVAEKSTNPTVTDIPDGFTAVFRNTTTGNSYLWANIGGALIKTQLQ